MKTRFSVYTAALVEASWLVAVGVTPLFINLYARNYYSVNTPAFLRSLAVVMAAAWAIAVIEERVSQGVSEITLSTTFLKQPLILPAIAVATTAIVATLVSIVPHDSLWGSYTRGQGLYTVLAYVFIFLTIRARLRTRTQLERLVTALLLPTFPIGAIATLQAAGFRPIGNIGLSQGRMGSTLGNPISLGGYLIMVIPLTVWRIRQTWRQRTDDSVGSLTRPALYTLLLLLQVAVLVFSQSRGPILGLAAGVVLGLLVWAAARRSTRVVYAIVAGSALLIIFLLLLNVPQGPLTPLRDLPYVGRLGKILDPSDRGIATGRVHIWSGVMDTITADPLRTLIGYGPDTLGIAFDRHYPVGFLQVFNGAPERVDRAHNVLLDVTATRGLLGLAAYLALVIGMFQLGLQYLGLLGHKLRDFLRLAAVCLGGGLVLSVLAFAATGSSDYTGAALSLGVVAGLGLLLFWKTVTQPRKEAGRTTLSAGDTLVITLMAGLVAHWSEATVGIRVTETQLLFWTFAALLAVLISRGQDVGFWETSALASPSRTRGGRRRERGAVVDTGTALPMGFRPSAWGAATGLMLVTLAYDLLVPDAPRYVWLLMLGAWAFYAVWMVVEGRANGSVAWQEMGAFAVTSLVPWILFAPALTQALAAIRRNTFEFANLIWLYFSGLLILLAVLAWTLCRATRTRRLWSGSVAVALYPVILVGALTFIAVTNVKPMRADTYYNQARAYADDVDTRTQAIQAYQRAISLAPDQTKYYQSLGSTLFEEAERTGPPAENNAYLNQAQQALYQAHARNPQDVTVNLALARVHWRWAEYATDQQAQIAHLTTATQYYQQAATLRPNQELIRTEWAYARSQLAGLTNNQGSQDVERRSGDASAATDTNRVPVGVVEEKPHGNPPRMWIECPSCAQNGEQVPLLGRPAGEPVASLAHGSEAYVLNQRQGPDGRIYYLVWGARRQGWVPDYRLSSTPP